MQITRKKEALLDKTIDFFFKDIIEEGEEILNFTPFSS
jgi:hypothetical protein